MYLNISDDIKFDCSKILANRVSSFGGEAVTHTHIKYNMVVSTHIITIYGRDALLSCGIRIWEVRLSPRMLQ
jgi:hypothetical protein